MKQMTDDNLSNLNTWRFTFGKNYLPAVVHRSPAWGSARRNAPPLVTRSAWGPVIDEGNDPVPLQGDFEGLLQGTGDQQINPGLDDNSGAT
jgi:hypothetical protein